MAANPRFFDFLRLGSVLLALAVLAPVASAASRVRIDGKSTDGTGSLDNDPPVVDARLHVAGNLRLGMVNCGLQGESVRASVHPMDDPAFPPADSFSQFFEFPAGSYALHLYEGGLWIGGIVDGDTLVTTALNAVSSEAREFTAFDSMRVSSNIPGSPFYDPSALSHQQFYCRFSDTLSVRYSDELDNRPHYPVGVEVAQTSHAWLSEPYDDFVLVVSTIRNISDHLIECLRFGMFTDADCYTRFPNRRAQQSAFSDDVSGYLRDQGIGYTIDSDGDPVGDTLWDSTSIRSAYSVVPIAIEPEPCCTTFDWWGIDYRDPWPFGEVDDANPPRGDRGYYRRMASGTIEDDQIFFAAPSGRPPRDPIRPYDGIAAGMDTRFLLAFGSYDLQPGDSVSFVYAFVGGDSVHQDPSNFATNFNAGDPRPFYNNLYFGDLIRNAEAARLVWNNSFDLIGAAPPRITFKPLSDKSVEIHWAAAPFREVAGYRIYRRIVRGHTEWELVGETIGANVRHFTDRSLSTGLSYEYAVAAVCTDGEEGFKSRPFAYKAGLPLVVPAIEIVQEKMDVAIKWSVTTPKATFSPPEILNVFRRTDNDSVAVLHATVPIIGPAKSSASRTSDRMAAGVGTRFPLRPPAELMGTYHDSDVESGTEYWYSLTVTNTLGLEGQRSEEVRALPMAFDREGIVLVEREEFSSSGDAVFVNEDSTQAFYFQWAQSISFDSTLIYAGPNTRIVTYSAFPDRADLLTVMSRYRTVIFVSEARRGYLTLPGLMEDLTDYVARGGRMLFVGSDLPVRFGGGSFERNNGRYVMELTEGNFTQRILGIDRAIVEIVVLTEPGGVGPGEWVYAYTVEFAAARSLGTPYPDLVPDSARAAATLKKLMRTPLPLYGGGLIPAVGALLDFTDAEPLYTYEAGFPDTSSMQGLPVAIRSNDPDRPVILINAPLSVMERESAIGALNAALADLGNMTTSSSTSPRSVTIDEILDYIYHRTDRLPTSDYDTNGDGVIDLRDAVQMTTGK